MSMTKKDLAIAVSEKTGITQVKAAEVVQELLDVLIEQFAAGQSIELRNFGVFDVTVRKARIGRNPNKPETDIAIESCAVVKFRAGKVLRQALKNVNLKKMKHK